MTLTGARLADEAHELVAIDEIRLCQGGDPVTIEGGLAREVEAGRRLDGASGRAADGLLGRLETK
jgi:hypothetical protein